MTAEKIPIKGCWRCPYPRICLVMLLQLVHGMQKAEAIIAPATLFLIIFPILMVCQP